MPSEDDVEEFAALLRRLKGRTDRSYAALARRLDMNASTLHRYCSGEAVPLGFAPVERFAAMCGASPAERVELHRLWILAVAARQRPRPTPAAAPEATVEPDPVPGPAPVPERGPATAHPPVTDPEPVAVNAPEAVSAAEAPAEPGPAEPPPATESEVPSPGPGSTPWYRRRAVVAAVVVTALLATLGGLSTLPSGHSTAGAGHTDDAGDRVSGARAGGARRGSATPSASPSAPHGRKTGTPAPDTSGGDGASSGATASPSPGAGSAGTPIAWTVNSQLWATGCDHDYVIDKAPDQVPPPPAPQDAAPWARTQNAVHGGQTLMDISVQGRTDTAVVLEALRVRVVGRSAPLKGTDYFTGQGCGGDLAPGSFKVDLDVDRPIARPVANYEGGTTTPARHLPYRVSAADPEVLTVDAQTEDCDCSWVLELDWSSQGRTGTVRIDDHGRPFRTSGIKGLPRYWYTNGAWVPEAS